MGCVSCGCGMYVLYGMELVVLYGMNFVVLYGMDFVFRNFIDTSLCFLRAPTSTCQTHFVAADPEIFLRSNIGGKEGKRVLMLNIKVPPQSAKSLTEDITFLQACEPHMLAF